MRLKYSIAAAVVAIAAATPATADAKPALAAIFYSGAGSAGASHISTADVVMTAESNNSYNGKWTGRGCGDSGNAVPKKTKRPITQLAGWSLGRTGPIYYLKENGGANVKSIILFDPGAGDELDCDASEAKNVRAGQRLARWLKGDSQRRLLIMSGAASMRDQNAAVVRTYLNVGINYSLLAKQVLVCSALDEKGHVLPHENVLLDRYGYLVGRPARDSCPTMARPVPGLLHIPDSAPDPAPPAGPDPVPGPSVPSPAGGDPDPGTPAPVGTRTVTLRQGPAAPAGYRYSIALAGFAPNSSVSLNCYDSASPAGFYPFSLTTDGSGGASTAAYCYSGDGPDHWVIAGGVESNHVSWGSSPTSGGGTPLTPPAATGSITAAQGGAYGCSGCYSLDIAVHGFATGTYTYYCHDNSGAGGSDTVFYSHAVTVTGTDQSTWPGVFCYDSAPYRAYLVMGGITSNTVQFSAPAPPPPAPPPPATTWTETTGGVANTWTNYSNAGGTAGQQIASHQTVQIACKIPGFRVSDGNTWWYRIASSPWNNQFYVSADAFYNNGQTSGSLVGTPFVDPAVANC